MIFCKRYRLFLENVSEVAEEFKKGDLQDLDAETLLIEALSEPHDLNDVLFFLTDVAQTFNVEYEKLLILEIGFDNSYLRFLKFEEAVEMFEKEKNLTY